MRFVFLIPDLDLSQTWKVMNSVIRAMRPRRLGSWLDLRLLRSDKVYGGTLNLIRHCLVARQCGADAVLATMRGEDTYGDMGLPGLPFIRWADRRPDDICIIPDFATKLIDRVEGVAIAYLQVPIHVHANFNYQRDRIRLWTDSPMMLEVCRATYPGASVEIVPNVVDNQMFPFIPQAERQPGVIFAFPRKGAEFIEATRTAYQQLGGTYWQFELIDGLSIHQLAREFRRPQAFLASAPIEGCALPPQESMAAGVIVVGRTAKGANFCMEHRQTAMVAETPEQAAECLLELEAAQLRETIALNAHQYISRYFPDHEPRQFWQQVVHHYNPQQVKPVMVAEPL